MTDDVVVAGMARRERLPARAVEVVAIHKALLEGQRCRVAVLAGEICHSSIAGILKLMGEA